MECFVLRPITLQLKEIAAEMVSSERNATAEPVSSRDAGAPRVDFRDELARRRRGTWRLSLLCLFIASGIGAVLSALVTPLLLLIGGALLKLGAALGIAPAVSAATARSFGAWAAYQMANFDLFSATLDKVNGLRDLGLLLPPLAGLSSVMIPALVAAAVIWLCLRRLLLVSGGADMVGRLKARAPLATDREEHQLANIVEEMAIAAGIPAPRLFVIDSDAVNAAALGRSHRDATVLVTRGLIDRLDRVETAAVIGHLIATIGSGDVKITDSILAAFHTCGFFVTFLDLPFRWAAWRALGGFLCAAVTPRPAAASAMRVGESLEHSLDAETIPSLDGLLPRIRSRRLRHILLAPLLPFMILNALMKMVLFLWTALFLGPPLSMLWRNRRYAADAMTVQLTRDPDGFARALEHIAASTIPPGGELREYFFIAGPQAASRAALADRHTTGLAFHPPIERRLRRLVALGAAGNAPRTGRAGLDIRAFAASHPLPMLAIAGLALLLVPLGIALLGAVFFLTAVAMTFALAGGLTLVVLLMGS